MPLALKKSFCQTEKIHFVLPEWYSFQPFLYDLFPFQKLKKQVQEWEFGMEKDLDCRHFRDAQGLFWKRIC